MAGTEWRERAACVDRDDLDWFDLDCNLQQTLPICYACPVANQCLEVAVRYRCLEGVWGGLYGKKLHEYVMGHRSNHAEVDADA